MSPTATPPPKKLNHIGLEVLNYKGAKSTLCAGCGQVVFRSGEKFESGTGWPSFFSPV